MALNTQTLSQFIAQWINSWASSTGIQPTFTSGDPVLGIAQAESAQAMYLQFQAQQTTLFARSTTCTGPDLDSFYAQFDFSRTGATSATGDVTLAVGAPATNQQTIAVGAVVQTVGGAIQYALIADTMQSAYNAGLNAYVLPVGQTSIVATAQALVPGSGSNVQPGQLIQFTSASSNFTSVTNLSLIDNGQDNESDASFRARFQLYITSLSKATYNAILEVCLTALPNFTFNILSNLTPSDEVQFGYFTVVVNNPGQTVSDGELATISGAVDAVRAFTIQYSVIAAAILEPPIELSISITNDAVFDVVSSAVQTAIIGYVNSLPIGGKLYLSEIVDAAINASAQITSVDYTSVTINSVQADYPVTVFQAVQAALDTVSVNQYSG